MYERRVTEFLHLIPQTVALILLNKMLIRPVYLKDCPYVRIGIY